MARTIQPGPKVLEAGQVTTGFLADDAVTSPKILDATIATADIAALAVTTALLASGSVDDTKLANDAVTANKILNGAVVAGKYGAGSIVNADISASAAIDPSKISGSSVSGYILKDNAGTPEWAEESTKPEIQWHISGAYSIPEGGEDVSVVIDSVSEDFSITMPTGSVSGQNVTIIDGSSNKEIETTGTVSIIPSDSSVFSIPNVGTASSIAFDVARGYIKFESDGTKWCVVSREGVGRGLASTKSELWSPPAIANADDDEFNSTVLDSAWVVSNATPATVGFSTSSLNIYSQHADAKPRVSLNTMRPSWLMVQPPNDNVIYKIHKPITLATNSFVWMRAFSERRVATEPNQASLFSLTLSATSGSQPSSTDYARIDMGYMHAATGEGFNVDVKEGGVAQLAFNESVTSEDQYSNMEYLGIHVIGSELHFWTATSTGSWRWLAKHTYAGVTLDRLTLWMRVQAAATDPGSRVYGIDFIRFLETDSLLP